MAQRALVTGATGLLGRAVVDAFERAGWQVTGTGLSRASPPEIVKVDVLNEAEVSEVLDRVKPHVVIHCAAERSPDICSKRPEAARALNVNATRSLAELTRSRSIFLMYISTDYVFSGKPGDAPYECDATPEPTNEYGQTKLDGERAVLQVIGSGGGGGGGGGKAICLRVPVLYGSVEDGRNSESAVNTLMDTLYKAQEPNASIQMDDWAQRYPTNTADVGRLCTEIAEKYLTASPGERGELPTVLHFSSEDRLTKYDMCQIFSDIMGLPMGGLVANKEGNLDPASTTQRPYDTHLSTRRLKELGVDVGTVDFKAWWRREVKAYRK